MANVPEFAHVLVQNLMGVNPRTKRCSSASMRWHDSRETRVRFADRGPRSSTGRYAAIAQSVLTMREGGGVPLPLPCDTAPAPDSRGDGLCS